MTKPVTWYAMALLIGLFGPRLLVPHHFFIQDEQPWLDRSQLYINSLKVGDLNGAARYPLSNHPAIPLMTVVGPVINMYSSMHGLSGTYETWSIADKREAAVWGRYVWGLAMSVALLGLWGLLTQLKFFAGRSFEAGLLVVLLGLEPWIWGISRTVSVDILMALGVTAALSAAWIARERRQVGWVAVSGACFALAFMAKSPALITAPLVLLVAVAWPVYEWRAVLKRIGAWLAGAYVTAVVVWPPFLIHPLQRLRDVLLRAEMHSTTQEIYVWPGWHPPFFIFALSTFAAVGLILYIVSRVWDMKKGMWQLYWADVLLVGGAGHGLFLLLVHGDHGRKNLPVLALLAAVGIVGWLLVMRRWQVQGWRLVGVLIILQAMTVWPYWPHVMTAYNHLVPSEGGRRLLVDIGNGSRLIADYMNKQGSTHVFAIPMDSLVGPYLDPQVRSRTKALPAEGRLANLSAEVTDIVVPASLPARVEFDPEGKQLLEELGDRQPRAVLGVKDVPLFLVYAVK